MGQELKVIQDFYDFMLWTINHTAKFPRHHRHSLGVSIENRLQLLLSLLVETKYTRERAELFRLTNLELEILRFQFRMAKDLKLIAFKSHGHAAERMLDIGRQVGLWARKDGSNKNDEKKANA